MLRRVLLLTCAAAVLPFSSVFAQDSGAALETITVDARAAARPFPHFWEIIFGSGRANLSLRDSYRRDLDATRAVTSIQYMRFHAILQDENGIYDEDAQGHPVYNFSYLDQIYDGLLDRDVRPFVELSFMPRKLASSQTPHPFWYKPSVSPPNNYAHWDEHVTQFTRHLIERYGAPQVEQWYFEVWNEPNLDFGAGRPNEPTYYELYDHTARAVKSVSPNLRVGGPATAQAAWVDRFSRHCVETHAPVDFVSTHVYANDKPGRYLRHARKHPAPRYGGPRREESLRSGASLAASRIADYLDRIQCQLHERNRRYRLSVHGTLAG